MSSIKYYIIFCGFPSIHFAMFSKAIIALFCIASCVSNPICGDNTTFLAVNNGFSAPIGGSVSKTSTLAPAIFPLFKASAKA